MTQIQVSTRTLRQLLDAEQHLGTPWGKHGTDVVIAERFDEVGLIQVFVRRKVPSGIALIVRVDPPTHGSIALSVAGKRYRERLDYTGCVVFDHLAEELFTDSADTFFSFTIQE